MSFSDSFWTSDYNSGCRILFTQLYEGIKENELFITMFKKRSDSEMVYGEQLLGINPSSVSARFQNEDYVSTIKTAFLQMNENFASQGNYHIAISEDISAKVVEPFTRWSLDHKQRIEFSDSVLLEKYKVFKSYKTKLEKLQKRYFNKCRILEEFKANFEGDLDENISEQDESITDDNDFDGNLFKLGDCSFTEIQFKKLLNDMLTNIELKDHKVAILGTYSNVSSGSSIAQWLTQNVEDLNDITKLEGFGKDLISQGFLRLIGSINQNNFINSSQFYYQWKPKTFDLIGYKSATGFNAPSGQISEYFEDMKHVMGVNIDFNDKSQYHKLNQEVNSLDQQYYQAVMELDKIRCEFEELIMDHLTFMEKCEFDRLKAIKKVLLDFIKIFHPYFKTNKALFDELLILEETINPVNDLKFLIENFKIGKFKPVVTLYDNYYNSNINQTFGVDLSIKSRLDKKIVPILIQCILSHLDSIYPDLANDEERVNLWIKPVQLSDIHSLRFKLNDLKTSSDISSVLESQSPMIITNILKLYLLELPDSLVLHNYYEIIKSLYLNYPVHTESSLDKSRLNGLQNVLSELPKCNLATLDAILTHLNRLIQIISKKDKALSLKFKQTLSKDLSSIIILPKRDHLTDAFQYQFIMDLFDNKDEIFKNLRRNNSNMKTSSKLSKDSKPIPPTKDTSKPNSPTKSSTSSSTSSKSSLRKSQTVENDSDKENEKLVNDFDNIKLPELPKTPSKRKEEPGLKRSSSPNKSSLKSYLDTNVVSSKPSKKDIDVSELTQPKFTKISRKSSVKDLASKFEQ